MAMVDVGPVESLEQPQMHSTEAGMVKITDDEASQLDLISLITRLEWRHVMDRMKVSPQDAKKKQIISMDGSETLSYPLHLAVSKKPPVRKQNASNFSFGITHTSLACLVDSASISRVTIYVKNTRFSSSSHLQSPLVASDTRGRSADSRIPRCSQVPRRKVGPIADSYCMYPFCICPSSSTTIRKVRRITSDHGQGLWSAPVTFCLFVRFSIRNLAPSQCRATCIGV